MIRTLLRWLGKRDRTLTPSQAEGLTAHKKTPWYMETRLGRSRFGISQEDRKFLNGFNSMEDFEETLKRIPKYELWVLGPKMLTISDGVKFYHKNCTGNGSVKKSLLWYC